MNDWGAGLLGRGRRQAVLASAATVALTATGGVLLITGLSGGPGPPPLPPVSPASAVPASAARAAAEASSPPPAASGAAPSRAAVPGASASAGAAVPSLARSVPVALDIPAIGVHTRLIQLGLQPDGTVAVPPLGRTAPAGWYRYLATPGEAGPAVILGHVDSARDGPAVFYRLGDLRPGDRFSVRRADGSTARFTVRKVAAYAKADFPSAAVYGPADGARLRLVTCGGSFDRTRHQYRDNIVAFADFTGPE